MQILVREKSLLKLDKNKRDKYLAKMIEFSNEILRANTNRDKIRDGYNVKTIEGTNIRKFRVNSGDRIYFCYYNDLINPREGYDNLIVFLGYCNHDKQIREAKSIDTSDLYELGKLKIINYEDNDVENQIDKEIIKEYEEDFLTRDKNNTLIPDLNKCKTCVVDEDLLSYLLKEDDPEYFYYLHDKQFDVLNINFPIFLFGSAGSGKTTVSIHQLFKLSAFEGNFLYITFTGNLKEKAKEIYEILKTSASKIYSTENMADHNIKFLTINDLCGEITNSDYQDVITYHNKFFEWYKIFSSNKYNFNSFDIWQEIRGIIKGFMGINWRRNKLIPATEIKDKDTIEFLKNKNILVEINKNMRTFYYLKDSFFDIKMDEILNSKVKSEISVLFENTKKIDFECKLIPYDMYMELSDKYCTYNKDDREHIYSIAESYQEWLDNNGYYDENDISRNSIQQIKNNKNISYDYIVCDEVQDLTELQIYLLFSLLKDRNSKNIFLSGDIHQIINPTYFDFGRLENFFYSIHGIKVNIASLTKNYRSQAKLVNLSNKLSELRTNFLGKEKDEYDYKETFIRYGNKPFLLSPSDNNKMEILKAASERHYAIIIVANEEEKERLKKLLGSGKRIFTVQDIKGLEYKYVVCYNLLSSNIKEWTDIVNDKFKGNSRGKYYFNMFYVAITRAIDNLCIYEEEDVTLLEKIKDHFSIIPGFDINKLQLSETSSSLGWEKDGEYLEEKEKYEEAINSYREAGDKEAVERCKAKNLKKKGLYDEAGDKFLEIGLYKEALECFEVKKLINKIIFTKTLIYEEIEFNKIECEYNTTIDKIFTSLINDNMKEYEFKAVYKCAAYIKTPLHKASEAGHKKLVELLISKGFDVNAKNNDGMTSLELALKRDHKEVAELLISKGAISADLVLKGSIKDDKELVDVESLLQGNDINTKDSNGTTPLDISSNNKEIFISKGTDVNFKIGHKNKKAWLKKGKILCELKKYEEAIQCYDNALKIDIEFEAAWNNKGITLSKLGKYEEAIKLYNKAIEINPELVMAWCNKGNDLNKVGKNEEAIQCFDKALELNPKNILAHYNKGNTLVDLDNNEEAIQCFDKVLKINPNHVEAWSSKGVTLGILGNIEEAIQCFDKALEINPNYAIAWNNKGNALHNLGRYGDAIKRNEEAIKCFDKSLKINPKYIEAWSNKGVSLGILGNTEKAIKCFNKALEINPKLGMLWYNKGNALSKLGKYEYRLSSKTDPLFHVKLIHFRCYFLPTYS